MPINSTNMLTRFRELKTPQKAILFAKRQFPLHSMVTSAGYEVRNDASYDYHGLSRGREPFVLFQYTLGGSGELRYEGDEMEVAPGTLMMLFFPHDNRYRLPRRGRWEFFYLCFNGSEMLRMWKHMIGIRGPLWRLAMAHPAIMNAAALCVDVLNDRIMTPLCCSRRAYELGTLLMEYATGLPKGSSQHESSPAVAAARSYCDQHLSDPIGVDDLAAAAGLSRYHFSRLFTNSVGISPGQYIARRRLDTSVSLLQHTVLSIKEIAMRCGFGDSNYFCRVFRKAYGVSPGTFRRSGMFGPH